MAEEKDTGRRRTPLGVVDSGDKKTGRPIQDMIEDVTGDTNSGPDAEAAKAAMAEQIAVLKEEVARLRESLGVLAESSGQYAVSQVNSLREEVRGAVTANPLAALIGAAMVGYLFGLRRR